LTSPNLRLKTATESGRRKAIDRQFIQAFEGPKGRSELFEIVGFDFERPGLESVEYEVIYRGTRYVALTMGEASIVACDFAGDNRFLRPVLPSPPRHRIFN
jgi:hypothetical protein